MKKQRNHQKKTAGVNVKRKHEKHGNHGIVRQISAAFLIPILFVILIGTLSYKQAEKGLREKYEEAAMTTINMTNQYIDLGLQLVEAEALKYAYDKNMNEYFMGLYERDNGKKAQIIASMQSGMKSAKTTNKFINDIHIITASDITMQTTREIQKGTGTGFFDNLTAELEDTYGTSINSLWMDRHDTTDERLEISPDDYILSYYCTSTNSRAGIMVDVSRRTITDAVSEMDMGEGSISGFITAEGNEIITGGNQDFSLKGTDYYTSFRTSEDAETTEYISSNGIEYLLLASKGEVTDTIIYAAVPKAIVIQKAESIKLITVFMVILSCIIALITAFLISLRIGKRMKIISTGLSLASSGDLTSRITMKGNDEFTDISCSINTMMTHMNKLVQGSKENVSHVSETALEVKSTSETINKHSQSINNVIGEINLGAARQNDSAVECQQKMDTLSGEIKNVLNEIEKIQQFAESSHEMIKSGIAQMNCLSDSSTSTSRITSKITDNILNLSDQTKSIEEFVDMIDSISSQTNLLSLNASIEAARAGEAGKGFAVVAEEIRKLADSSVQAASQIRNVVLSIRAQMNETTQNAGAAGQTVALQTKAVETMNTIFDRMSLGMAELLTSVDEISRNVEKVNADRHSTKLAVENISEVIQTTSASAAKVSVIANELSGYAEDMDSVSNQLTKSTCELEREMENFRIAPMGD